MCFVQDTHVVQPASAEMLFGSNPVDRILNIDDQNGGSLMAPLVADPDNIIDGIDNKNGGSPTARLAEDPDTILDGTDYVIFRVMMLRDLHPTT
jgi:hypothetical protein